MSRRRAPIKIAPSPAGEKPENQAVEEMVRTSQKHQEEMRKVAGTHSEPKKAASKPKIEPSAKQKITPDENPDQKPSTSNEPTSSSTRLSLNCPINLMMDTDAQRIADTLGKDREYVIKAFINPAKEALGVAWETGCLYNYTTNAQLLMQQNADGGTRKLISKHTVKDAMITEMRNLIDDPLGLTSPNQTYAIFLGAALMEQLKRRDQ